MGPYKFPNDTVYVGQWYVIYYLTRTVNRMEKDSTIFQISRILKAILSKVAYKVFYKLNQVMAASFKQTVITTKGSWKMAKRMARGFTDKATSYTKGLLKRTYSMELVLSTIASMNSEVNLWMDKNC